MYQKPLFSSRIAVSQWRLHRVGISSMSLRYFARLKIFERCISVCSCSASLALLLMKTLSCTMSCTIDCRVVGEKKFEIDQYNYSRL